MLLWLCKCMLWEGTAILGHRSVAGLMLPGTGNTLKASSFFFLLLSNTPSVTCPCKHTPPHPPPHYCHHNITIIHTHHKHIYTYHIYTHITKRKNTQPCTHTSPYAQISPHTQYTYYIHTPHIHKHQIHNYYQHRHTHTLQLAEPNREPAGKAEM